MGDAIVIASDHRGTKLKAALCEHGPLASEREIGPGADGIAPGEAGGRHRARVGSVGRWVGLHARSSECQFPQVQLDPGRFAPDETLLEVALVLRVAE